MEKRFKRIALGIACGLLVAASTIARAECEPDCAPNVIATEVAVVDQMSLPGCPDSNNPAHWDVDGQSSVINVFTSCGDPQNERHWGSDLSNLSNHAEIEIHWQGGASDTERPYTVLEATYKAANGDLFGWYHAHLKAGHGPYEGLAFENPCSGPSSVPDQDQRADGTPVIGALRSQDDGATWTDLGIVLAPPLTSSDVACETCNIYHQGGYGDFAVIGDSETNPALGYLYFVFSSYRKEFAKQGVAMARIKRSDLRSPVGKVRVWHAETWGQGGIGGDVTPVLPAVADWHPLPGCGVTPQPYCNNCPVDAYWGPSVHFNTCVDKYVMLLTKATNNKWWTYPWTLFDPPGGRVWVSFSDDLANPDWSAPQAISGAALGPQDWYSQVIGMGPLETDKLAGESPRLFVYGFSKWDLVFSCAP